MSNFIYSGAEWTCPAGGKGKIRSNSFVKIKQNSILTNMNLPFSDGTGVCSINNGIPCSPACVPGTWIGTSLNVICNGRPVLTNSSTIACSRGGIISIQQQNSHVSDAGIAKNISINDSPNSDKPNEIQIKAPNDINIVKQDKSLESNSIVAETNKKNELNDHSSVVKKHREHRWCSGRCPLQYTEKCEFCEASENEMIHKSDSLKLKQNIANRYPNMYRIALEIINEISYSMDDEYKVDASAAHHHLIPGNECYGKKNENGSYKYQLLIKLGNLFDYDINCSENGILLPTFSNPQLNRIFEKEKPGLFFYVMDMNIGNSHRLMHLSEEERMYVGSQLHVGQHIYEKRLSKLRMNHPKAKLARSYEHLVMTEFLDTLNDYYNNRYEETCFMRDFEKEKKIFVSRMNTISNELRKLINAFPKRGEPLYWLKKRAYVSFPALLYDIGITEDDYKMNYSNEA